MQWNRSLWEFNPLRCKCPTWQVLHNSESLYQGMPYLCMMTCIDVLQEVQLVLGGGCHFIHTMTTKWESWCKTYKTYTSGKAIIDLFTPVLIPLSLVLYGFFPCRASTSEIRLDRPLLIPENERLTCQHYADFKTRFFCLNWWDSANILVICLNRNRSC